MMRILMVFASCAYIFSSTAVIAIEPDPVFEDGFEDFCPTYFTDSDGDGYGNPDAPVESCVGQPPDTSVNDLDCDDSLSWVNPDASDFPDVATLDSNCDGIDGDPELAVLVNGVGGSDFEGCGTLPAPCRTIAYALNRAQLLGRDQLYLSTGTFLETLVIGQAVSIWGGYQQGDWGSRATYDSGTQIGMGDAGSRHAGLSVNDATVGLYDLRIVAPDTPQEAVDRNSYGVFASNAFVSLERVVIEQGNGAPGANGDPGLNASQTPALKGVDGGDGDSFLSQCSLATASGGAGASNASCAATTAGGRGGDSGSMDTDCGSFGACSAGGDCSATAGEPGVNATFFVAASYGYRGSGGAACGPGEPGNSGRPPVDGPGGEGGQGGAVDFANIWVSAPGGVGQLGEDGTGGGGGGGAGGCDSDIDSYGGGGGGGGAGGCRSLDSGRGGEGGGGSFGVYLVGGSLGVEESEFLRGNGGSGGNGGSSGYGQPGGLGGDGGEPGSASSRSGGIGGSGSRGGHSGAGGGGAGGPSCAMVAVNGSIGWEDVIFSGGTGGAGGLGGSSPADIGGGGDGAQGELCQELEINT